MRKPTSIKKTPAGHTEQGHFASADKFVKRLAANFRCTTGASRGTIAPDAQKHHGFDDSVSDKAQQPRPSWTAAFFMPVGCTRHTWLSFLVGRVGAPAKVRRFLIPVRQPRTVCHPYLTMGEAGFKPVDKEPLVANTLTPKGRTAPASLPTTGKHSQTFDPVALHGEAVNACAMARWYAARHNHAAAARKAVQALSALRQLAAFDRMEVAHAR